jgi:hypothetical protein
MAVDMAATTTPPKIPPTMAGVFDLCEVGRIGVGMVICVVDVDDNARDLVVDEIANSGLLKGDERYVRTRKVSLVLDSDR